MFTSQGVCDWPAAMEPAIHGREQTAPSGIARKTASPQWSPPLKGGSTAAGGTGHEPRERAAMEPALDGREHGYGNPTGWLFNHHIDWDARIAWRSSLQHEHDPI